MEGDPYYALEKLSAAAHLLGLQRGSYQSRLETAFLLFHPAQPRDFPRELGEEYESICDELTCVEAQGDEGALKATLATMSDQKARELGDRIIELHARLNAHVRRSESGAGRNRRW